jgi:hypothetical protein
MPRELVDQRRIGSRTQIGSYALPDLSKHARAHVLELAVGAAQDSDDVARLGRQAIRDPQFDYVKHVRPSVASTEYEDANAIADRQVFPGIDFRGTHEHE